MAGPKGDIIVASSTDPVGGRVTVHGLIISAGLSNVVVDGSTYARSFSANAGLAQPEHPDVIATAAGKTESVAAQLRNLIIDGLRNRPDLSATDRVASGSELPVSTVSEMTVISMVSNQTDGIYTPTSIVDTARGTQSPTSTGGSPRNNKDVRLLHFVKGLYVIGVALAVL